MLEYVQKCCADDSSTKTFWSNCHFINAAKQISLMFKQKGELLWNRIFRRQPTFKFVAEVIANSGAMISDAVHSASDVFSSIVVIIGIHVSSKESDKEHPYGHERLECVAAIILATILCITGLSIGISAVRTILAGDYKHLLAPTQ